MKRSFAWLTAGTLAATFCFAPAIMADDEKPKGDDAVLAGPDVDVKKAKEEERMQMREQGAFSGRGRRAPRREGENDMMRGRGPAILGAIRQLDLTGEQKAEIKEILTSHKEAMDKWREEHTDDLKAIREKMRAARESEDREAITATRKELAAIMATVPKDGDLTEKVTALLTEEQKAELDEMKKKREQEMKKRREEAGTNAEGDRPRRPRDGAEGDRPRRPRGEGERPRRPREGADGERPRGPRDGERPRPGPRDEA